MLQLTYISSTTKLVTEGDVDQILAASRRNNTAAGITGLLLYDGRRFLQALEGEQPVVERTYARIKADPRHRAVVLLGSADVTERAFGNWSMAAERVMRVAGGGEDVPAAVDRLTEAVADRSMQAMFRSFARVRAAA